MLSHTKLRRKFQKKPDRNRQLEAHLQNVRGFKCVIANNECSGRIEAAHVRNNLPPGEPGTERGMGYKPSAAWTVPLCEYHHAEQHRIGEQVFCRNYGISMVEIAQKLAGRSPHLLKLREAG